MPSQPLDQGWNFSPVFDLIDSDPHDIGSPTLRPEMRSPTLSEGGVGLGDFSKLYESLGLLADAPIPPLPLLDESDSSISDDAALACPSIGTVDRRKEVDDRILQSGVPATASAPGGHVAPTGNQQQPRAPPSIKAIQAPRTQVVSHAQSYSTAPVSISAKEKIHRTIETIQPPRTATGHLSGQRDNSASVLTPLTSEEEMHLASITIEAIQAPRTQLQELAQTPGTTSKQRRKARRQADQVTQGLAGSDQEVGAAIVENPKMDAIPETPSKTKSSRAQSNVGAKVKPASPPALEAPVPKTPVPAPRPVLSRQRSSMAPATPKAQTRLQTTVQPAPQSHGVTRPTTGDMPAPFQYSLAPQYLSQLQPSQLTHVTPGLVPRTVRPVTLPRQSFHASQPPAAAPLSIPTTPSRASFSSSRQPALTIRQQVDRHFHLFEMLMIRFPEERKWLVSPKQLVNENVRAEGIHVFVDASNIMIGFKDILRNNGVQPYDMSFDSLALLMERRRPTAKRALVGSHREAHPLPATQRLIGLAKDVGYQCDVQEQVFIAREESSKKKFFNDVNRIGWQKAIQKRSGSGSDSETGAAAAPKTPSAPKWVEQGVDELLHLKMCQSMLDTDLPSTMVLATGDGAEAEMSDGFLAHVERALRKGWKVELITWKQQMNGGYRRRAFRQKWGEQFTVIELDDYLEDLIDTP